jgi:signal transduction histidine kinase
MVVVPFVLMVGAVGMTRHIMELPGHGPDRFFAPGPSGGNLLSLLLLFIALIVCNSLLSWWVSSGIIRPLRRLKEAAGRIGEGDLDSALPDKPCDLEFAELSVSFETMRLRLRGAYDRQMADDRSRRELIAHVSHDLRTPIAVIRGYAEGLRDGVAADPGSRARYLETILAKAREMEDLIETLFAYSTLDLDGVKPRLVDFDLAEFLVELAESMRGGAGGHAPLSVSAELPERLPVIADPTWVGRIMGNLVDNTLKHGGVADPAIVWRLSAQGGQAVLRVADNGAGVPEADLPRLFEPFFRGDRSRSASGAGLGLAIVGKLMAAMGGSARAERAGREEGAGLAVILEFRGAHDV